MADGSATSKQQPRIDFWDPHFFDDPDPAMRWLLEEAPVYLCDPPNYPAPFWVVSKWEDVRVVEHDWERFTPRFGVHLGEGLYSTDDPETQQKKREAMPKDPRFAVALRPVVYYDPPEHTRLRALARDVFRPSRIRALEPATRRIVTGILDDLPKGEVVDIVEALAWVPLRVVCEVLGVGEARAADFKRWADAIFAAYEPGKGPDWNAMVEMFDYLETELEDRRRRPREDALSDFVTAEYEGTKLSTDECLMWSWLLLAGGQDTTTNLLNTGLRTLLEHPGELAKLVADPSLVGNAVNELLRWVVPDRNMGRTAVVDTEIRGVPIAKGDFVLCNYVAANRDPDVFDDPFTFDVSRDFGNDHLSFGFGAHYCIGATLSRLEGKVFFEELLGRFPGVALGGTPVAFPSIRLARTQSLPVVLAG